MIKALLTILAIQAIRAVDDPNSVVSLAGTVRNGDQYFDRDEMVNLDFSLPNVNRLCNSMTVGAMWTVNLKDESKFTLEKTGEVPETESSERVPSRCYLRVYIFFPGDLKPGAPPETALHMAFKATYEWHDLTNSYVPKECNEDFKTVSLVDHECKKAVHVANEIIQLQITGTVQQKEFSDLGLERCIQSKIQMKDVVNLPYMKCLIKILGDPKYKDEIIAAKIADAEKKGYICNELGECVMHEDPGVVKALLENLAKELENKEPVPINIPFDGRERFCAESTVFMLETPEDIAKYKYDTYEYGCNHWVEKIYWNLESGYKLKLALEYVSYKEGAAGEPVFVSRELQYTSRFEIADSNYLKVDWKNGERIRGIKLWRTKSAPHSTFSIEFNLARSDGSNARTVVAGMRMAGPMLNDNVATTVSFEGEIVGMNVSNSGFGTIVHGIDLKQ